MAAASAVTFQTTINKLAGALEGGLNDSSWRSAGDHALDVRLTAKVFLGAYLLSYARRAPRRLPDPVDGGGRRSSRCPSSSARSRDETRRSPSSRPSRATPLAAYDEGR